MNITHSKVMSKVESPSASFADSPSNSSPLPENPQDLILFLAVQLTAFAQQAAEQRRTMYDVEKATLAAVLKIGHAALETFLRLQGDGDLGETITTEEGQTLQRSEQPHERSLRTIFGQHSFSQYVYAAGPKKKIELCPLDAQMNLSPGVCSPLLEEFSQHFCVDQAFGIAGDSLKMVLGQTISVSLLERVNVAMGQQAEEFLNSLPEVKPEEEGQILVITADGKGVPMVKKDRRDPAQEEPENEPGDFASSSKKLKQGKKRMATLASVYSVDVYPRTPEQVLHSLFREPSPRDADKEPRPEPKHKRLFASFGRTFEEGTEDEVTVTGAQHAANWAADEAAKRLQNNQTVVVICDGQKSLWNALTTAIAVCFGAICSKMVEILDLLHVSSYLWKAGKAFYPQDEAQARRFVRERMDRILRGQVAGVIRGMRTMCTVRKLGKTEAAAVHAACNYFAAHQHRMRYDEYLAAGYPIASGVIEGACRHIVKDRLERSGMRWTLMGSQAMLWLRCVYGSELWEAFQRYRAQQTQTQTHPHYKLTATARSSPSITPTLAA